METYRIGNERTWLRQLLPLIIKDSFQKEVVTNEDYSATKTYTTARWETYGLVATTESDFRRTTMPNKFNQLQLDEALVKALAKDEGMSNPRPDECYGLSTRRLALADDPVWTQQTMALMQIAPLMHHPFLVVEGKSAAGNSIDSENQAAWDCACLIHSKRLLYQDMGEPDVTGADLRTIVFSMTLGVDACKLWVHWAEVQPSGVRVHMTRVKTKALDDDDVLEKIRSYTHNILHWGLVERLPDLEA
ncbi:MAG: hypothetical protein Q9164_007531, partial [Protoblastenia rupestris]